MYLAIFSSAYYRLLRVGEITSGTHPILAQDVHAGDNKRKILFILTTSKTHWTDKKPQHVKISSPSPDSQWTALNPIYCPFKILCEYIVIRPSCTDISEPFFVSRDKSPVKSQHMRNVLKLMLAELGLNNTLYDTHSYRFGHCCDLYHMGICISKISKIGRWKSSCVYTYLSYQ